MAPDQIETISDATRPAGRPAGRHAARPRLPGDRAADHRGRARRRPAPGPPRDEGLTVAGGIIYLDIDDEITSAAARIRAAEGRRVARRPAVRLARRDVAHQLPAPLPRRPDPREAALDHRGRRRDPGPRRVGRAAGVRLRRRVRGVRGGATAAEAAGPRGARRRGRPATTAGRTSPSAASRGAARDALAAGADCRRRGDRRPTGSRPPAGASPSQRPEARPAARPRCDEMETGRASRSRRPGASSAGRGRRRPDRGGPVARAGRRRRRRGAIGSSSSSSGRGRPGLGRRPPPRADRVGERGPGRRSRSRSGHRRAGRSWSAASAPTCWLPSASIVVTPKEESVGPIAMTIAADPTATAPDALARPAGRPGRDRVRRRHHERHVPGDRQARREGEGDRARSGSATRTSPRRTRSRPGAW